MPQYQEPNKGGQVQSSRCFAHDLAWLLVFAKSQENRLPQLSVARPLREFHLANEHGIHPGDLSHHRRRYSLHPLAVLFRRQIRERTIVSLLAFEFLVQGTERLRIESGPDFAGEEELFLFIIAYEDRAEMLPRALRRGEPAADKFLFVDAF